MPTFKGNPAQTLGNAPEVGSILPEFTLVGSDLSEQTLAHFSGKVKVLNIFPSLDTGTCAASVRRFNKVASELPNVAVLCISKDLPFAQKRFCTTEGLENVVSLSAFRSTLGKDYGIELLDTPLKGLLTRTVIVADADNNVLYVETVSEITVEPNYEAALAVIA